MFVSEEILNLFAHDENNIYNEKEIVDTAGKTFRIDKLIVRNDEVIIVDFKSSNSGKEKNEEQLRRYVSLVSEIYPNKKISAYIADIENAKCLPIQ